MSQDDQENDDEESEEDGEDEEEEVIVSTPSRSGKRGSSGRKSAVSLACCFLSRILNLLLCSRLLLGVLPRTMRLYLSLL